MINDNVLSYLNFYLDKTTKKSHAIMLDGAWGSGKTFLVKSFFEEPEQSKYKVIYVSLYGVSKTSEVDEQIFQQLYPILSNKYVGLLTKAVAGAVKIGFKFDITGGTNSEASGDISIPSIDLKNFFKIDDKELILVFDDLERCVMQVEKILGYINYFCEHQDQRIIIIANQNEIRKEKKFYQIREKLIGRTFAIKSDSSGALDSFLADIPNSEAIEFLKSNRNLILKLYESAGYNNLRSLKQAIIEWPRIYSYLPKKAQDHREFLIDTLTSLLVLSFEFRKGAIELKDLYEISSVIYSYSLTKKENNPYKEIENKYAGFFFNQMSLGDCWFFFFKDGFVASDQIEKSLDGCSFFHQENTPAWKKILYFQDMEQEKFDELLLEVRDRFEKGEYARFGEIKHVISTLLFFSERRMISDTAEEVIALGKRQVLALKKADNLIYEKSSDFDYGAYSGIIFLSDKHEKFIEFLSFLDDLSKKRDLEIHLSDAEMMIKLIGTNAQLLWNSVTEGTISRYQNVALFKNIQPEIFVSEFMSCPNRQKRYVAYFFQERYQFINSHPILLQEKQWLTNIKSLMEVNLQHAGILDKYHIERFISNSLNPVISNMESLDTEVI